MSASPNFPEPNIVIDSSHSRFQDWWVYQWSGERVELTVCPRGDSGTQIENHRFESPVSLPERPHVLRGLDDAGETEGRGFLI